MPTKFRQVLLSILGGAVLCCASGAGAQHRHEHQPGAVPMVKVDKAWIRASVNGQSGTGGFMDLTASRDLSLTGFSSRVAKDSELHEMAMDAGGVMRMRPVDSLALPAGRTVSLKPGMSGHHLMLMGLKRPLKDGDKVELTLQLRTADGRRLTQKTIVPVKKEAPASASPSSSGGELPHDHGHHHQD